jgi:hypothetical protein
MAERRQSQRAGPKRIQRVVAMQSEGGCELASESSNFGGSRKHQISPVNNETILISPVSRIQNFMSPGPMAEKDKNYFPGQSVSETDGNTKMNIELKNVMGDNPEFYSNSFTNAGHIGSKSSRYCDPKTQTMEEIKTKVRNQHRRTSPSPDKANPIQINFESVPSQDTLSTNQFHQNPNTPNPLPNFNKMYSDSPQDFPSQDPQPHTLRVSTQPSPVKAQPPFFDKPTSKSALTDIDFTQKSQQTPESNQI